MELLIVQTWRMRSFLSVGKVSSFRISFTSVESDMCSAIVVQDDVVLNMAIEQEQPSVEVPPQVVTVLQEELCKFPFVVTDVHNNSEAVTKATFSFA